MERLPNSLLTEINAVSRMDSQATHGRRAARIPAPAAG